MNSIRDWQGREEIVE